MKRFLFCFACGKSGLSKIEIGLNKKLVSRKVKVFYCVDCLADYFELSIEELMAKVDEFKAQGCSLF